MIATTIVTFEEQLRGWLEFVKRGTPSQLPTRYDKLRELSEDFNRRVVLPFDNDAVVQYEKLLAGRTGVGTMDLRIASIVLARGELLVSRNLKDFRKIPDLRVEDWTRA